MHTNNPEFQQVSMMAVLTLCKLHETSYHYSELTFFTEACCKNTGYSEANKVHRQERSSHLEGQGDSVA